MFKRLKGRELWWGEESACLREGDGWDWRRIGGETFMGITQAGGGSTAFAYCGTNSEIYH